MNEYLVEICLPILDSDSRLARHAATCQRRAAEQKDHAVKGRSLAHTRTPRRQKHRARILPPQTYYVILEYRWAEN